MRILRTLSRLILIQSICLSAVGMAAVFSYMDYETLDLRFMLGVYIIFSAIMSVSLLSLKDSNLALVNVIASVVLALALMLGLSLLR